MGADLHPRGTSLPPSPSAGTPRRKCITECEEDGSRERRRLGDLNIIRFLGRDIIVDDRLDRGFHSLPPIPLKEKETAPIIDESLESFEPPRGPDGGFGWVIVAGDYLSIIAASCSSP